MLSFAEFIRSNKHCTEQRSIILNLNECSDLLIANGIHDAPIIRPANHSFYSYLFTQKDHDISYKLEKIKLKLIDKQCFFPDVKRISKKTKEGKRLAWITILALADRVNGAPIIEMLTQKDYDLNQPIMKIKALPTYVYLHALLRYDKPLKSLYQIQPYCGISPVISHSDVTFYDELSFATLSQYKYLLALKRIFMRCKSADLNEYNALIIEDNDSLKSTTYERPLFLIDLLIMKEKYESVNKILTSEFKMGNYSMFCYLLHSNTDLTLNLLKSRTNPYNNYLGLSPLHVAAMRGSCECVAIYIELAFSVNERDFLGNTPLHYAAINNHLDVYNLLKSLTQKSEGYQFEPADEKIKNNRKMTPLDYFMFCKPTNLETINIDHVLNDYKVAREKNMNRRKFMIISPEVMELVDKFTASGDKVKKLREVKSHNEIRIGAYEGYSMINCMINLKPVKKCKDVINNTSFDKYIFK